MGMVWGWGRVWVGLKIKLSGLRVGFWGRVRVRTFSEQRSLVTVFGIGQKLLLRKHLPVGFCFTFLLGFASTPVVTNLIQYGNQQLSGGLG